jgi:hypothetical protein
VYEGLYFLPDGGTSRASASHCERVAFEGHRSPLRRQRSTEQNIALVTSVIEGTTYYLFGVIQSCDVVIHLVPAGKAAAPDELDVLVELSDKMLSMGIPLLTMFNAAASASPLPILSTAFEWQAVWYEHFYGFDIRKGPSESWQEWEIRVSDLMGITFIRVCLVDGPASVGSSARNRNRCVDTGHYSRSAAARLPQSPPTIESPIRLQVYLIA